MAVTAALSPSSLPQSSTGRLEVSSVLALRVPPTLHLLPWPPYRPEWNPVEHLREYVRENYIGNHVFSSLDAVIDQLSAGLHHLHQPPNLAESMTCFDWLKTIPMMLN